ncbi:MAG: hypothetical protein IID42_05185 [Planctomycetes bacterium]|nr:hypothetical protein [Planctomycetota bacterium]
MIGKRISSVLLMSSLAMLTSCNRDITATQIQHTKMDKMMAGSRAHLTYMADNAMLHDMSLADLHFVPHTRELSGTGIARLDRMAVMLDTYGGTVRYETYATNEAFIQERLDHVREYLATTGCDMSRVEIKTMLSGGRGMSAVKALGTEDKLGVEDKAAQMGMKKRSDIVRRSFSGS